MPATLNDSASDIWEPLFALADLAGGGWPELAREAATNLSASAEEDSPFGSLLLDIFVIFNGMNADRLFTRTLVATLNNLNDRPWRELTRGKVITERWFSQQLRPYGIRPRTMRIGETQAKGYNQEDFMDAFRRYMPKNGLDTLLADLVAPEPIPRQEPENVTTQTTA